MNQNTEIRRLLDLMSASGRMQTKLISKPQQPQVIFTPFPLPWHRQTRPIYINFELWQEIPRPQRDLLLLRAVSWLTNIKWFQPQWEQGVSLLGVGGMIFEFSQGDAMGAILAGGLTAIAMNRIWRKTQDTERELDADQSALKVALRRGYSEVDGAKHLREGIYRIAQLEGRKSLSFNELLRIQNLKMKG